MRTPILVSFVVVMALAGARPARAADPQAEAELKALAGKVKRFRIVDLKPGAGEVVLTPEQSLTVDDLRGVPLDDNPPVLGQAPKPFPPQMEDDCPPDAKPYVARGIRPFRFRYFNNEFNYGGWHTWNMTEYAGTHGFNILSAYNHKPADWPQVPAGTQWLAWGGYVDWHKWLPEHQLPAGRYDLLPGRDLPADLAGTFKPDPQFQLLMIDMEHGMLPVEKLREQEWYPKAGTDAEKAAFEGKYYQGYALTYAAVVEAARQAGWRNISVYGWEPFGRRWSGLEKAQVDPATDWAWNAFGKRIYQAVDILNPSVYCFYWSPQNVAYTLALVDLNMKVIRSLPNPKPLRPYYWTLLHGGGAGWRWWANQPQPDEDVRAMTALGFFTGFDGFDTWNWSGTGSHVAPPPLKEAADVMLKDGFDRAPEGGGAPAQFRRYDVLHVRSVDPAGVVTFQRIEKENGGAQYGTGEGKPLYTMPRDELAKHLRPSAEPVAATVEGMALVRPLEYILRHGEVKVDVPAQEQFAKTLPIVRRVKLGDLQVLATYDPMCIHGGAPREIALRDFDGRAGLTLRLPADSQTRLFVLRER